MGFLEIRFLNIGISLRENFLRVKEIFIQMDTTCILLDKADEEREQWGSTWKCPLF